ncbi:MAG: aspartate aminotransferase family protein [Candidatus Lambdaproteobacteria bacterium]|nr:aspartate aminotransferase family protein [Candidatus Lambdaproteobacteria bacterium]
MATPTLQAALSADRQHVIHPLHHPSAHTAPRVWVKGKGAILTDLEGNDYIDGLSGLWNVNVGHGRKELAQAAARQMETLAYASGYVGSSNLNMIALAERLAKLCYPQINTFFFTSGGGESTETSIKTARFFWKALGKPDKVKFISRKLGYHGVTLAAMSATGMEQYWPMFEPRVPGFSHIPSPYPYYFNPAFTPSERAPTPGIGAANLLEQEILAQGPETVAAFIAEPVQGAGGVIVPQDDYFKRIREICDQYEVLFIADEVITGFGRTGRWFALDHWGVQPDMVNFAKGVTSGYLPLGGVGVSDRIRDAIHSVEPAKRYMHAYTYSGHPTCCAVALANLDVFDKEDLVSRAAETGAYLLGQLRRLEKHPNVGEARGLGMMAALEIVEDKAARKPFAAERKVGELIHAETAKRGLWTRARGDVYCLAPPLITTREQVDRIVTILDASIAAVLGR